MQKFLLLLHEDSTVMENLSAQQMEQLIGDHFAWAEKLGNSGYLIEGEGLEPSGKMIVGKNAIVKDISYIESKEIIGGFYLLQAPDFETVIEIAKQCPCHIYGGTTEIRPIAVYES